MGRVYDEIDDRMAAFLLRQPVFFVATAPRADDGHINLSPKGLAGSFSVVGPRSIAYLDLTGSGVETIAHLRENGRIVVMVCAFQGPPRILRLHGRGTAHLPSTARFDELRPCFEDLPGVRSIIEVEVQRIADSCGFGVPLMQFVEERSELTQWALRKGPDGVAEYHALRNRVSLDGLPGIPQEAPDPER